MISHGQRASQACVSAGICSQGAAGATGRKLDERWPQADLFAVRVVCSELMQQRECPHFSQWSTVADAHPKIAGPRPTPVACRRQRKLIPVISRYAVELGSRFLQGEIQLSNNLLSVHVGPDLLRLRDEAQTPARCEAPPIQLQLPEPGRKILQLPSLAAMVSERS